MLCYNAEMGDLLFEFGLRVVVGVVLVPVLLAVGSPVIWIVSLFGTGSYMANVYCGYGKLMDVWGNIMDGL